MIFVTALVLFLVANRAAYKGYFSDDDLDSLGWSTIIDNQTFAHAILTPEFSELNFRPTGNLYYRYLGHAFQLRYPPYVVVLQALHIANVVLLFFLLRRLDFSHLAAGAAALFYAFHAATLEAYWKPMYIFEVLCCFFCLLTLLLYVRGHWIAALVPFWLAYKSKEIAVMLPVAILACEWMLGQRKWKRVIPFFLISLSFGLQALLHNRAAEAGHGNIYVLQFAPELLWKSIAFYSSAILFVPFAGLALLVLPIFIRDRRLYAGIVLMAAVIVPMLALPNRLMSVYWYVPMIGVAIAFAAIASRTPRWAIALFFAVWLPLNYVMLREKRRTILALGDESRWLVTSLQDFASHNPPLRAVVYDSLPEHMHQWGIEGAIHNVFGPQVNAVWYHDPRAKEAMARVPMALVTYYPVEHTVRGMLRTVPGDWSYVRFSDLAAPPADITLYRPDGATEFEILGSLQHDGPIRITVLEDKDSLGVQTLANRSANPQSLRWKLSGGTAGVKRITIITDPRDLRIAIHGIGYVPSVL